MRNQKFLSFFCALWVVNLACDYLVHQGGYSFSSDMADIVFIISTVAIVATALLIVWNHTKDTDRLSVALYACVFVVAPEMVIMDFATLYRLAGIQDGATGHITHDFWTCIYFSIVTFTTLGYGDFRPTQAIRLLAASEALVGYFLLAATIAVFAKLLGELSDRRKSP